MLLFKASSLGFSFQAFSFLFLQIPFLLSAYTDPRSSLENFEGLYEYENRKKETSLNRIVPCAVSPSNTTTRVTNPQPAHYYNGILPESFDWRHVGPSDLNMVVTDRTHFSPSYCAGCWAMATTTTLSDRVKIMRLGSFPEINLSPQPLLTCQQSENGCHGGSVLHAVQYIHAHGVTDETCSPITGEGKDTGDICQKCTKCFTCDVTGECAIPKNGIKKVYIDEFGVLAGENAMVKEIHERGPIVCHMITPDMWMDPSTNRGSDSAKDSKILKLNEYDLARYEGRDTDHAMEIAGWGVENGEKYWVARNTWGVHWGTKGWVKIPRGRNFLKIESNCIWFTPVNNWSDLKLYPDVTYQPPSSAPLSSSPSDLQMNNHILHYLHNSTAEQSSFRNDGQDSPALREVKRQLKDELMAKQRGNGVASKKAGGRKKTDYSNRKMCPTNPSICSTDPECGCEYGYKKGIDISADGSKCYLCIPRVAGAYSLLSEGEKLPRNWDWRNIDGKNYLTFTRNQHNPQYCGGCWSFATTSSLADRINIHNSARWPNVAVSPQVIINCRAGGDCYGGDQFGVYDFMYTYGVPTDTCMQYKAKNFMDYFGWCPKTARCATCDSPASCRAVEEYPGYYVSDFGRLHGIDNIKAEVYKRGPVTCGVSATEAMDDYEGGIFFEKQANPEINHEVSIVGWGEERGEEYWAVRNSWGSFWGEHGYIRIRMRGPVEENNLIATECSFAVPGTPPNAQCGPDGACSIRNEDLPQFEEDTLTARWPTNNLWLNPVDQRAPGIPEAEKTGFYDDDKSPIETLKWPKWFEDKWRARAAFKSASPEDAAEIHP